MGFTDRYGGNSFNIQSFYPAVTGYVLKPLHAEHMVYGLSLIMLWIAHLWRHDFKMFFHLRDLPPHSSTLSLGTLRWRSLSFHLHQQINWGEGLCAAGKALQTQQGPFYRKPQMLSRAGVYVPKVWIFKGTKTFRKLPLLKSKFSLPRHLCQHTHWHAVYL